MSVNFDQTKEKLISFSKKRTELAPVTIDDTPIERTEKFKSLGVVMSSKLDWSAYCELLHTKDSQRIYLLVLLRRTDVADNDILRIYTSMIRLVTEYAAPAPK